MKTIITEKPSVAREIATVLNVDEKNNGYFSGNGYAVTWAFGHLIELSPPESYGWKAWVIENLPMIPAEFILRATHKYNSDKKVYEPDKGVLAQMNIINDLFGQSTEIIVATDAGREGELIFRYIYQYLNCTKPFKRLWISSLTKKAIVSGFASLQSGEQYDNLFYAAKCRSEADWLVGMNASRALSIAAAQGTFSIGRVQTPTLAIICARFIENKNFNPEPYYSIKICLAKQSHSFVAYSNTFKIKETADNMLIKVKATNKATVVSIDKKEKVEQPPLLYDLTTLQREANKIHSLTADETLKTAQSLYEKKFITYPRTSSCYIPEDIFETIPGLLKVARQHELYGTSAAALLNSAVLNLRAVTNDKITDHHAILITEHFPSPLTANEQHVYDLVTSRMIEAFSAACVKDVTVLSVDCAAELFRATGSTVKTDGWKMVRKSIVADEEGNEETPEQYLPDLIPHEAVNKQSEELLSKMTKPKPLHTEASLLAAMETCGKLIEEEELKDAIKDNGIGTPATRANIIETLLLRGYIERQRKSLVPTPKGLTVYELLKDKPVASPELTGEWEKRLNLIHRGEADCTLFMQDIVTYTKNITAELLAFDNALKDADLRVTNKAANVCPKCKKGEIKKGNKNYYCTRYKEGCDFIIWPLVAGKTLTQTHIADLCAKGKTAIIKGFKKKAGPGSFDAKLALQDDFAIRFEFDKIKKATN